MKEINPFIEKIIKNPILPEEALKKATILESKIFHQKIINKIEPNKLDFIFEKKFLSFCNKYNYFLIKRKKQKKLDDYCIILISKDEAVFIKKTLYSQNTYSIMNKNFLPFSKIPAIFFIEEKYYNRAYQNPHEKEKLKFRTRKDFLIQKEALKKYYDSKYKNHIQQLEDFILFLKQKAKTND